MSSSHTGRTTRSPLSLSPPLPPLSVAAVAVVVATIAVVTVVARAVATVAAAVATVAVACSRLMCTPDCAGTFARNTIRRSWLYVFFVILNENVFEKIDPPPSLNRSTLLCAALCMVSLIIITHLVDAAHRTIVDQGVQIHFASQRTVVSALVCQRALCCWRTLLLDTLLRFPRGA